MNILANLDPQRSVIVDRIRKRLLNKDQNYIAFIAGNTGTGKSESALSLCCAIDNNFSERNVVTTVDEFIALLQSGHLKKGSAVLFDEYAVRAGARDWYTVVNKVCIEILQTFRVLNLAVFFTAPSLALADKKTEILLHGYFETVTILRRRGLCKIACADVKHSSRMNETYKPAPLMWFPNSKGKKRLGRVAILYVGLAPSWLCEAVKKKLNANKHGIIEESKLKIEALRMKEEKKKKTDALPPELIADRIKRAGLRNYTKVYSGRLIIDVSKIFADFDITYNRAIKIKAILSYSDEFKALKTLNS